MSGAFCVECGQQGAGHAGAARMQATVVNPRSGFRMTGKIWIKVVYIGVVILAFTFVTNRLSNLFPN
jgi:hypothetical protein